jgi:hypothetical protein
MRQRCSRREILQAGFGTLSLATVGSWLFRGTADAQQKVSKQMVHYQDSPKGGHQCSGCSNFVAPDACKVVVGKISPHGWCAIWTPK